MMKILSILVLLISLNSCKLWPVGPLAKNRTAISPEIVGQIDSVKYLDLCCNFMNSPDSTTLTIIMYAKGCSCGVLECASNCVGIIDNNDTIRVLSLCEDKSFYPGQIVTVIPSKISGDLGNTHIAQHWESYGDNRVGLTYLTRRKFNAIWGQLKATKTE